MKKLASALGLAVDELAVGGIAKKYLTWVRDHNAYIDFRGIGLPQFHKQPIDDLFVEPILKSADERTSVDLPKSCDLDQPLSQPQGPASSQALLASDAVTTGTRIVILGDPGGGKTTLLRWLAHGGATSGSSLPILLRLGELSRALEIGSKADLLQLITNIASDRNDSGMSNLFRQELEAASHCLVLLDGLDEVGQEEQRSKIVSAISTLIERYPNNRFVLTSRIVGFEARPWTALGFSIFRIQGHDDARLRVAISKWAKVMPEVSTQRSESDIRSSLSSAIFANPRVAALAANPLILTILVILNESRGGALPRRRVDLYAKVVEVFLDTWEQTKRTTTGFEETSDIDLDAREFCWLLSDLALAMQKNERTLAPRWWIAERMHDCLQTKLGFETNKAKDASERILSYLTGRAGLIEERGVDQFGFSHRTLQEYFASRGVIDESESSRDREIGSALRGYFFNPRWREVIRLTAAAIPPQASESLISAIVDDPDPIGRFLHRGPQLALQCLSDGATVPNRRLVDGVFDSVLTLGASKWLGITSDVIDALQTFIGTRLEARANETISRLVASAKTHLQLRDYVFIFKRAHWTALYEGIREKIRPHDHSVAAVEVDMDVDGHPSPFFSVNSSLLSQHPQDWIASAALLLQDSSHSAYFKRGLIRELGNLATTDRSAHSLLVDTLRRQSELPVIRRMCASMLEATGEVDVFLELLSAPGEDISVQGACASSLETAAPTNERARVRLLDILRTSQHQKLRREAAFGLSKAAIGDPDITNLLIALADATDKNGGLDAVRAACAAALQEQVGENVSVTTAFGRWLDSDDVSRLRRVVAQCLATNMANEKIPWNYDAIHKIEEALLGVDDPCPHALESLEALATAREVRRGLRLEGVLRDVLSPLKGIEIVFVFGSTARGKQTLDSDIDLMIIGDIGLRDLSRPLREAEKILGRHVQPVIHDHVGFVERYRSGDAFLADVVRREKIPIIPSADILTERTLDDDLRAMVNERMD